MKPISYILNNCFSALIIGILLLTPGFAYAEDSGEEPLADRLREVLHHEAFTLNALLQTGVVYSFKDDKFLGGRYFDVANARISMSGTIDEGFFYSVLFNLASKPTILDAYVGYRHSDAFRVSLGAMKPQQSSDYIIHPGATDFITRANITGLLVESREIGLAAEGDIKGLYYYAGMFNGTGLTGLNNNKFYGIGRLQYTFGFNDFENSTLQIGIQGSHGDTPGVQSGSAGPGLIGTRTIFGGDLRLAANRFLFATEYMSGDLDIEQINPLTTEPTEIKETISGFYLTTGYWFWESTMLLGRFQSYAFDKEERRDNQITIGLTHLFTDLTSMLINFDLFLPDEGKTQYGVILGMQVMF